jgi:hypothetical protein
VLDDHAAVRAGLEAIRRHRGRLPAVRLRMRREEPWHVQSSDVSGERLAGNQSPHSLSQMP